MRKSILESIIEKVSSIRRKNKQAEFEKLARPLIEYLCENHHPHTKVIIDCTTCEIVEGIELFNTEDYLVD